MEKSHGSIQANMFGVAREWVHWKLHDHMDSDGSVALLFWQVSFGQAKWRGKGRLYT
jgi:hypothetical protein